MSKIPNRTFGVELEITGLTEYMAWAVLRMHGVNVEEPENYSENLKKWRFHEDCSIRGNYTCEVVSPILTGAEGLREVRKVCALLQKAGAKVNASCGLHVHVGAKDLSAGDVMTMIKRYAEHEGFIDRLVPGSRRGNRNEFCGSMKNTLQALEGIGRRVDREIEQYKRHIANLEANGCHHGGSYYGRQQNAQGLCSWCQGDLREYKECLRRAEQQKANGFSYDTVEDMADEVCERYRHINLQAYLDHGTLEFRQHNGCIDGQKVANWIRFVLNFVEQSRALAPREKDAGVRVRARRTRETYRKVVQALRVAGSRGLTPTEIARLGGWKHSGVPAAMRRLASTMNVKIEMVGRGRYSIAKGPRHRTVDNGPLMGLPGYLKNYFQRRAAIRSTNFEAYA